MSERPTPTTTLPTPERGAAENAGDMPELSLTPVATVEHESVVATKSPAERFVEIEKLPPTVASFREVLNELPARSVAYVNKNFFTEVVSPIINAKNDADISEPAKNIYEYAKSELYATMFSELVDMDTFGRKTIAFPENPKAGKVAYIIEDLKKAAAETTDPQLQMAYKQRIAHMEKFAEIVDEEDEPLSGEYVKRYIELANNPNANPKELEAAKQSLLAIRERNLVRSAAYKVILYYFPSEKGKQQMQAEKFSPEARVSLRPEKLLGVDPNEVVQGKNELERAKQDLAVFRESEKPMGVVAEIVKRTSGRSPLDKKANAQTKLRQLQYSKKNYEVFQLEHMGDSVDRFNKLATYVVREAIYLQKLVNSKLTSQQSLQTMDKLKEAIKEAREQINGSGSYDELEVYNKLQSTIFESFEEGIRSERKSALRNKIDAAVDSAKTSERARNVQRKVSETLKSERSIRVRKIGAKAVKGLLHGRKAKSTTHTPAEV